MSQPPRPTLSACIIARDEAVNLPACLESVSFCDEIVVVDSGSTDDTRAIAAAAGARVIEQPWLGFPAQRNVALDNAACDWVLEIDADERVTAELRNEILSFLEASPNVDMAAMPTRHIYLGGALGPSAKYPEYRRRLLMRGSYRHDERRTVHEALIPHGPVHPLEGELEHLLAAGFGEAVGDAWRYARLEAGQMQASCALGRLVRGALVRPTAKFFYRLIVDGGWRDGWRGIFKIWLDCAVDSTVWIRHFLGRRGEQLGNSGVPATMHYGATNFRRGTPRIVGVADPRSAEQALRWLDEAAGCGADVALICEGPFTPAGFAASSVRVRTISTGLTTLRLIRALDAEQQLRSIDAVIPFGSRARRRLRMVPWTLRGTIDDIRGDDCPPTVVHRMDQQLGVESPAETSMSAPYPIEQRL